MPGEGIRGVLLDIEGTVCSISFVRDVLFPYALRVLPAYLREHWTSPDFEPYKAAFPEHAHRSPEALETYVRELSEKDVKVPCLKGLQGLLWRSGYENGFLKAPIYSDVFPAVHTWVNEKGLRVMIYSSGSVEAQRLFVRYTDIVELDNGDLTPYLSGFYDTVNAGMKQDPESYRSIAKDTQIEPEQWIFLSDSVKEVEAATAAGMNSMIVMRPGNTPLTAGDRAHFRVIDNGFTELIETFLG